MVLAFITVNWSFHFGTRYRKFGTKKTPWTNQYFTNLYKIDENMNPNSEQKLMENLNLD
jgi:hypothetical protein